MMKVYIYCMHAGTCGSVSTCRTPLDDMTLDEIVHDHADSYYEQDEDGEWSGGGDPEIWLETTVTTLKETFGYILCGSDTLEGLIKQLEKEGMVW